MNKKEKISTTLHIMLICVGFILAIGGFIGLIYFFNAISHPGFRFVFGGCGQWLCRGECEYLTGVLLLSIWTLMMGVYLVIDGIQDIKKGKVSTTFRIIQACHGFILAIGGFIGLVYFISTLNNPGGCSHCLCGDGCEAIVSGFIISIISLIVGVLGGVAGVKGILYIQMSEWGE